MSKIANLQNALNSSSDGQRRLPSLIVPSSHHQLGQHGSSRPGQSRSICRHGYTRISKRASAVQAKKTENATLQDLMAEAFNDLFSKYNVPAVNEEV